MTILTATGVVKALLAANWTKANTDNKIPVLIDAQDDKDPNNATRLDAAMRPYIKIYEDSPEDREANGIGYQGVWKKGHVTVDIIVGTNQTAAIKIKNETVRVIESNAKSPGGTFQFINPSFDIQNFSGTRDQKLWRWVISITIENTNVAYGG